LWRRRWFRRRRIFGRRWRIRRRRRLGGLVMKTFSRLWRHVSTTTAAGRRAFPEETLKAIEEAITEGETRHRAEVHMIVEPALDVSALLSGMSSRERARELFSDYRVWVTEENCGVLVYVNL